MYLSRILSPVQSLGIGNRIAVWTAGCSKCCAECSNPELWSIRSRKNYSPAQISQILHQIAENQSVNGITFTGGDPLEQSQELLLLLALIQDISGDILIYTGYTLEELKQNILSEPDFQKFISLISVLIDGRYIASLNTPQAVLKGSLNQNIYYFRPEYQSAYEAYLQQGRKIQNFFLGSELISVGIHNRKDSLT